MGAAAAPCYPCDYPQTSAAHVHLKPPPTELFGIASGSPERQLLDATLIGLFGYRSAKFGHLPWSFRASASGCLLGCGLPWLVGGAQLPPTTLRQCLEGSLPPSPWLLSLLHHGLALCRGPPAVNSVVRLSCRTSYRYCTGTALCCTDLYWYSYYFADAVLVGYDTRTYRTVW